MDTESLLTFFQELCAAEKAPQPLQDFEATLANRLEMGRYKSMVSNLDAINLDRTTEGVLDQKAKDIELLFLRLGSKYDGYYDRLAQDYWHSRQDQQPNLNTDGISQGSA